MQSLQPQIVLAVVVASSFYKDFGYDLVVTSFSDGIHSPNSLHYSGNAVDLRTRNVREVDMMPIIGGIRRALGSDFDVIFESDHLHIEYQPK